jgi:hypothetical protein
VDEDFARVGAKSELIVKLDVSHSELCNIHFTGPLAEVIVKFLQSAEQRFGAKSTTATILGSSFTPFLFQQLMQL